VGEFVLGQVVEVRDEGIDLGAGGLALLGAVRPWVWCVAFFPKTSLRRSSYAALVPTYRALKDREVFPALHQWLSHAQRDMLEKYAPERYALKNGKTARIVYDEKQPPSVSAVLQHMYDVTENPKVAAGRISVTVHLLSPAQRPIQTTGDLGRFWREGYPGVKAQLRGRYPKHEWR
jgi:HrpA-like RNA helicase